MKRSSKKIAGFGGRGIVESVFEVRLSGWHIESLVLGAQKLPPRPDRGMTRCQT